ncbi:hypothetical protein KA005_74180 [bacterium]|nr:hypothetical protein [bacterium]
MEIAKGVKVEDYKKLNLDTKGPNTNNWLTAIDYLEKRLSERFVEPAELLIESERHLEPKDKKFGFTILAIDFLLTETLQCFYEGIIDSTGQSKFIFARFLTQRDSFKSYFKTPEDGERFYIEFRCGILHQAQTSADTKVWTVGDLIWQRGQYTIVNRNKYHDMLLQEIKNYLKKLRARTDITLLKNFKTKMDFICGV